MIRYYSLFHFDDNTTARNAQSLNALKLYLNNIVTLKRSMDCNSLQYTLITNSPMIIDELTKHGLSIDYEIIDFATHVPLGTRFYNAHFKRDVFRYFGTQNQISCLLDIDMVCLRSVSASSPYEGPCLYDVTDQINGAYGYDTVNRDLTMVLGKKINGGRWFGGEFILGDQVFYSALTSQIDRIYKNYLEVASHLHHVGDEAFTSAAINQLLMDGYRVNSADHLVMRYWNDNTKHEQKPLNFDVAFLHLPADKSYLAKISNDTEKISNFRKYYWQYINKLSNKARLKLKKIVWG